MRFLVTCTCMFAAVVAFGQDATALDEVASRTKTPPKLTLQASAEDGAEASERKDGGTQ